MKSLIFGRLSSAPSTSAVSYVAVGGTGAGSTATESSRNAVIPDSFTLGNLLVSVNAAPGGSAQYVFTIRKNGADTAITLTISGSATTGSYSGTGVSFVAGDKITMSLTPSSTPTAPTTVQWTLQADSDSSSHFAQIMGAAESTTNLSTSVTSYANTFGHASASGNWSATETDMEIICPTAGTLANLYVLTNTAPATGKSYAITLVKNGVATALVATVSNTATTANDTIDSVSVVAGDTLSVSATPSGTPTAGIYTWGIRFTPSNPGESIIGFGNNIAPATNATQYEQPLGLGAFSYNGTETTRQMLLGSCAITALYASIGTAPGTVKSRTVTVRKNAASTSLAVTISGTNTSANITGQSVGFVQSDLGTLQLSESGTPAVDTGGVHIGLLVFIPVASSSNTGGFFAFMKKLL